jgi:hypothetical protein
VPGKCQLSSLSLSPSELVEVSQAIEGEGWEVALGLFLKEGSFTVPADSHVEVSVDTTIWTDPEKQRLAESTGVGTRRSTTRRRRPELFIEWPLPEGWEQSLRDFLHENDPDGRR